MSAKLVCYSRYVIVIPTDDDHSWSRGALGQSVITKGPSISNQRAPSIMMNRR